MADGNIGSLWLSLGIRDAVSKELNRIADGMTGVDAKTKKAQESLRKLAEENPAGKNVAFLDKLKKAVGDSTKEAKELQAVFEAIRNIRGGFGTLTGGFGKKELLEYEFILRKIHSSLGKISFGGLSGTGEGIYAKIEAVKSAMNGLRKINAEINRLHETAPRLSPKEKAEYHQTLSPLFDIRSAGENYLRSGVLSKAYAWANSLDEQISKISSSYEKFLSSEKGVVESLKKEEEQSKKTTDATNEQTNALKKQEEQLKATSAAQREKSAAESKAAVAPKGHPFVADKGLEKMLNNATRTTEKVEEQKKSLSGLSEAASKASRDVNEVLNKIVGGNAAGMSLDELAKKTARYSQELLELEAKLKHLKSNAEANPGKKGPDYSEVKSLEAKIKNAQIYLDLIQQIRLKKDDLNATGAKQPNVNTKELERGKALLDEFYGTLRKIVSENGVDGLMVLGNMPKALSGTMREIRSLLSSFSKENPLSVFANGADRAWTAISNLETKMRDLQRLMEEGKKMGYKTDMLPENFYELKRRLQELYRLFGDNSHRLTDKAYMDNLFSDVAKTMRIAANAEHEYGKEKGKTIAANKEAEAAENRNVAIVEAAVQRRIKARQREAQKAAEAEKEANRYAAESVNRAIAAKREQRRQEERDNKQRLSEIKAAEARYDSLGNKVRALRREFSRGVALGADVSKTEAEIRRLIGIMRYLMTLKDRLASGDFNALGRLGRTGSGHDTTLAGRVLQDQRAINAAQEKTNREKEKSIERAAAEEYNRQKRQKDAAKKAQDEELKNMSDYIKRYMTLVEEKRKVAEKAGISPFFKNDNGLKNIKAEIDTLLERLGRVREDITLYQHAIGTGTKEGISFGQQGLKEANTEAEKLMRSITNLQNVYDTLRVSQVNVKDLIGQTLQKQRQDDIQRRMSDYYSKLEKDSAQAAAKADREKTAAEKQRQNELRNTERRYDSLGNKVRQLRAEYSRGISLGSDTSKAEAEINRLITIMRLLRTIQDKLYSSDKWKDNLGVLGSVGSGHDTTLASRALQDQRAINAAQEKTNREKEKSLDLERAHQQEVAKTADKVRGDLAAAFAGANAESGNMRSILGDVKSLLLQGGIVYGAKQFFDSVVKTGGEIAQQHIALRSILGDAKKADELFEQTQQLALRSPFKFGELNRDVKQLAAFGVEADDLYDTAKRLADIASGLGVSFERLGLAYGQVKARSWLDGKELRQFAYAGLPLLARITELYNSEGKNNRNDYTERDVKEMISKRQVSFEDVQKVLWKMTDEGGQFYNMQLVLSETLLGRWNKLIDAWEIMLSKFADGKNVVGGVFMFFIDRATDLVLAMDKLTPAMLSFMSVFALKKLTGFASLNPLEKNLGDKTTLQLRSYAIEQQQLVLEGKITQQIATQNVQKRAYMLADVTSRSAAMNRLALEGKMSVVQMQKAVKEGLVSKELIRQLAIMGQITARQEQIILNGGRTAAVMNMAGTKLKSVFNLIGGWWGLAIGGIVQIASSIYGELSAIEEKTKSLQDPNSDWMKGYYDVLDAKKASNDAELRKQIEQMKKVLESSNAYTKTIDEQIKKAKDLNEQYEILRKGVEGAKNMASGDAEVIANAIGATGGWTGAGNPFNDSLEKNLQDMKESSDAYQRQLSALDSRTRAKMESVANSLLKPADASKTLEEKIRILSEEGGRKWGTFQARMTKWNKSIAFSIHSIGKKAGDVTSDINQIAEDDVPRIIKSMQKDFGLYGKDFKRWCKENPARFKNMLLQIMSEADWLVPQIRKKLEELTDFKFDLGKKPNQVTGKTSMQQRVYENLGLDQRKYNLVSSFIEEGSWYKTKNNAQTALQDLFNEVRSRERGGATKAEIAKARKDYNDMWNAVAQGLGYRFIPDDKKSNKDPKNKVDNEDKELKAWEERLNAFKSARQMYQKYKGLPNWGAKKADDMVRGLFPEVGDLSFDKYLESLEKLEGALKPTTTERKKAITALHREKSEWKYSEMLKPEADRLAADFAEILERGIRQADLHKALMEKTGDEDFASLAFRDGMMWDDQTRGMAQMFEEMTGRKIDGLLDATDATAKKALEDNTDAYNLWKKITDLVRNNYTGYLEKAADAIKETATWEEKLLAVDAKWAEPIKQADRRGDTSTAERFRQMRDKEKGQVMDAQFKQSQDYLNFFGAITEMGEVKAREVAADIRQHLNTALRDGSIDAREYAKQIQQIDEQLRKLSERRKGFFNGGITGIAERKTEEGNAKISMGATSVAAGEEKIREGRIKGDIALVAEGLKLKMTGEDLIRTGKGMVKEGMTLKKRFENIGSALSEIANIANGISDAFGQFKDMADALGIDTESDGWQDAQAVMSSLTSITGGVSKTFNAVKSGDIGGAVSGVASIITGPITAFAKAHDAKKERQIKLAERELKALENMQTTIKNAIEDSLGGIYNYRMDAKTTEKMNKIASSYEMGEKSIAMRIFGFNPSEYSKDTYEAAQKSLADPTNAYQAELTGLMAQRDQLQRQRANEDAKKKTDKDKLADYDQQIEEMERSIKNAAKNFLKDLYGVDMKSWASQLTDAVVSAWEKGEDAIDAYKKKAKEMVKDLTKNIISQKIMEQALQKPLDFLTQQIAEKGRLDEYDVTQLASDLYSAGENSVANITAVLEELKRRGWDFSESGSSSTTNTIKGVTEETADLLAAYLNAIRLDVSVNRENIKAIATNVSLLPAMSEIQKSQLAAMNQLVTLAQVRNDRIDEIVTWTRKVSNGSSKIYVK